MPRAPQRCSPSCSNLKGNCPVHKPARIPWEGSTRKDSGFLDSAEWRRQRRRVLYRDNENGGCQLQISEDCTRVATQVDHTMPVWYTRTERVSDDELQGVCKKCHDLKSSYEGVAAKRIKREDGFFQ